MQNLNFTFTKDQTETILQGLGKLPAEVSLNLILNIQKEAMRQIAVHKEQSDSLENVEAI